MKNLLTITALLAALLFAFGCSDTGSDTVANDSHAGHDHDHDHADGDADHTHAEAAPAGAKTGKVLETMDAGGYTYVKVDCGGGETIWAAGPQTEMAVGNEVTIATQMPMPNFKSESLDRTFDVVYFVNNFGGAAAAAGHGSAMGGSGGMGGMGGAHPDPEPAAEVDLSGIDKAAGGKTVAEVWEQRADLAGQEIAVRGRVVKYLSGIMGKNWLHVRDGSGAEGTNDLTITTQGFAKVGDLVTVTGKVAVDRDFGMGYRYDVIVEDATVVKE